MSSVKPPDIISARSLRRLRKNSTPRLFQEKERK
jgi:hypothetical protein